MPRWRLKSRLHDLAHARPQNPPARVQENLVGRVHDGARFCEPAEAGFVAAGQRGAVSTARLSPAASFRDGLQTSAGHRSHRGKGQRTPLPVRGIQVGARQVLAQVFQARA